MSELTSLTIAEARRKLRAKEITALELTEAYISAIDAANGHLNAYIKVTPDLARLMAKNSDERIAAGKAGELEGIPLGIKDLFATVGVHTQACSHILDGFEPRYESTVTQNLWDDGAVMLGKLNMDEFAMGSSNETSHYGAVINPWRAAGSNQQLVPGGSSGGSAAAVAAHLCAGATATDTGGSIRQPAAFTGTVGIKPTYGRCSRWGTVAFASSLDQAGPIARDVRDAAILLKSMASVDAKDTTSVDLPVPDYEAALGQSLKGMKIGIPSEYRVDGMPEEIETLWRQGIAWLKDAGAEIVDITLPHTKYALPAYYIVAPAEASSNLARYDGVRYGLRCGKQPRVVRRHVLVFVHDLLAFLGDAHDGVTGLALRLLVDLREYLLQAVDLALGLAEVFFEGSFKSGMLGGLRHFRQAREDLLLREIDILEGVVKQVFELLHLGHGRLRVR